MRFFLPSAQEGPVRKVAPAVQIPYPKQDTTFSPDFLLGYSLHLTQDGTWDFFIHYPRSGLLVLGPIRKAHCSCHAGYLPGSPLHPQLDSLRIHRPYRDLRPDRGPRRSAG
jgi:hypothetical protein